MDTALKRDLDTIAGKIQRQETEEEMEAGSGPTYQASQLLTKDELKHEL